MIALITTIVAILDIIEKAVSVWLLWVIVKSVMTLWRCKAVNDRAIQTLAIVVAMAVTEWTAGWIRAEASVVFIALCTWHIVSLHRAKKREAAKAIETRLKEIEELQVMTMKQRSR